ncbi:hypothetical protein GO491_01140 [Flavobacteriaceae bacterium Ap0902]|nr:hypothetical protein [Flavobacteriaceae bacterium Ap0902]
MEGMVNGIISYGVNKGVTSILDQNTRRGILGLRPKGKAYTYLTGNIYTIEGELVDLTQEDRTPHVKIQGNDFDTYAGLINGLALGNSVKTELIDWTTKNGKELSKFGKNYLKVFKGAGHLAGFAGLSFSAYDMYENGMNVSNSLDMVMGGVGFIPGGGWIVSGGYFLGNEITRYYTGRNIGQHIENLSQ